jgi:hypothetical protein
MISGPQQIFNFQKFKARVKKKFFACGYKIPIAFKENLHYDNVPVNSCLSRSSTTFFVSDLP